MMITLPYQFLRRTSSLFFSRRSSLFKNIETPSISVAPEPSISDEKVEIVLRGLPMSKIVTVYSTTSMSNDCLYESFALYETSRDGTVDLEKEPSIYGSYVGVEPMGLFWSMRPYAETKKKVARFVKKDVTTPLVIKLSVFDEEIKNLEEIRERKSCAATEVNRLFMKPGVRRIEVRENGLIGTLFLPPGKGPFPGLINLFGAYPGLLEFKSALHASHGFASLALAYIGMGHLPQTLKDDLDLGYFEKAVQFLKHHGDVDGHNGIGVMGICKGAQVALGMAAFFQDIRCVVSINGSHHALYGSYKYKDKFIQESKVHLENLVRDEGNCLVDLYVLPKPGETKHLPGFFPFHKQFHVSYLIIAGLSDVCMPSKFNADEEENLLIEVCHPDYEIIRYPDTGHLIDPPFAPFCDEYYQPGEMFNTYLKCGGEAFQHCKAQEDCWEKSLKFLKKKLVPNYNPENEK